MATSCTSHIFCDKSHGTHECWAKIVGITHQKSKAQQWTHRDYTALLPLENRAEWWWTKAQSALRVRLEMIPEVTTVDLGTGRCQRCHTGRERQLRVQTGLQCNKSMLKYSKGINIETSTRSWPEICSLLHQTNKQWSANMSKLPQSCNKQEKSVA